jgi:hypothetical protein
MPRIIGLTIYDLRLTRKQTRNNASTWQSESRGAQRGRRNIQIKELTFRESRQTFQVGEAIDGRLGGKNYHRIGVGQE